MKGSGEKPQLFAGPVSNRRSTDPKHREIQLENGWVKVECIQSPHLVASESQVDNPPQWEK